MGGRIAEELIFGPEKVTTGASSDIKMASQIARRMVTEWGMSEKLGFLHYGQDREEVFLGYTMGQSKNMSEQTSGLVDSEVRRIVDAAYARARETLTTKLADLHTIAKALLDYELLSGDEIKALLRGEAIIRDDGPDNSDHPSRAAAAWAWGPAKCRRGLRISKANSVFIWPGARSEAYK